MEPHICGESELSKQITAHLLSCVNRDTRCVVKVQRTWCGELGVKEHPREEETFKGAFRESEGSATQLVEAKEVAGSEGRELGKFRRPKRSGI